MGPVGGPDWALTEKPEETRARVTVGTEDHWVGDGTVDKRDYLRNRYLHAGAYVHRILWGKDRVEKLGRIGYFDDNNIVMNTLQYGEMFYINTPVYAYRQTGGSVYNSMEQAEKSILNVQGLDVDRKLLDQKWHKDLMSRYASPLEIAWILREKLPAVLGTEKHKRYLNGCRMIGDSIGAILLNWNKADEGEKKGIKQLVRQTEIDNPFRILYARISLLGKGKVK